MPVMLESVEAGFPVAVGGLAIARAVLQRPIVVILDVHDT